MPAGPAPMITTSYVSVFPMDLISSMPRGGETACNARTDDQTLEGAVAVRHRPDQYLRRASVAGRGHHVVTRNHLTRVEHADSIRPVRTLEYHGSGKRPPFAPLRLDIFS